MPPEMHPSTPSAATGATLDAAALWAAEDYDFALGSECADPALQIERWGQDDGGSAEAS
jgi:hypothetical protein